MVKKYARCHPRPRMRAQAASTEIAVSEPIDPTYPEMAPTIHDIFQAPTFVEKIKIALSVYTNSRLGRALARYSTANGALLAGGITYVALFSITGALTLLITIVAQLLGHNESLRNSVFETIDDQLPGVLAFNGKDGLVKPEQLVMNPGFSIASIIALIVLLLSAQRLMSAIKRSIRTMFGIVRPPISALSDNLRDFVGLLALLIGVILTGVVTTVTSQFSHYIFDSLGLNPHVGGLLITIGSLLLAGASDALVMWVLIRVVSMVKVPTKDTVPALICGVIASSLLRYLGTSVVSSVDSPMLASFAALITVLLWVNLLARLVLIISAFMANPPRPATPVDIHHVHADHTPNYVTCSDVTTLTWPHHSISGAIDLDWDANPNRPAQVDERANYRGGPIARLLTRYVRHLERRTENVNNALKR